jgi:hypothetical protein
MLGAIGMLVWLSLDSSWDRRGFWIEENLVSSLFYGSQAIKGGFGSRTLPGIALYLIVYSLLGALLGFVVRNRFRPLRTALSALVFALGWYYLSFHLLWKHAMPLLYLLYADRPMFVGHVIYGACLAAFPAYLPRLAPPGAGPGDGSGAAPAETVTSGGPVSATDHADGPGGPSYGATNPPADWAESESARP